MGHCFARCRLSASSVIVCNARGQLAAATPGAWPVWRLTLHGGTVRLLSVRLPVSAMTGFQSSFNRAVFINFCKLSEGLFKVMGSCLCQTSGDGARQILLLQTTCRK